MFTLYISGPMTGLPDFNRPAFDEAARQLRAAGYRVLNPAETRLPWGAQWEDYMRVAIAQIAACDGIAILPGWDESRGAQVEVETGAALAIRATTVGIWLDLTPGDQPTSYVEVDLS